MGYRADVIFMRVGQNDGEELMSALFDEAGIGHDDVDTWRVVVAEHDTEIDHDPLAARLGPITIEIEIHADLTRTAKRHEDQFLSFPRRVHVLALLRSFAALRRIQFIDVTQ